MVYSKKNKCIVLIHGSGGHNEQMRRLYSGLNKFNDLKDFKFISICDQDIKYPITETTYFIPTVTDKYSHIKTLLNAFNACFFAIKLVFYIHKKYDCQFILTTGPGISVIVSFIFKILGKKIIHVETWSRFYTKSITGRFMYPLADFFFVQNKELLKIYKKGIYKGRL